MEITEMTQEQKEEYKKLKEQKERQIKRQNKYNKENYDRVSATLPKGMSNRIKETGISINKAINDSLSAYFGWKDDEAVILRFPVGTKSRLENLGISDEDLAEECLNFIAGIEEIINSEELTDELRQEPVKTQHNDETKPQDTKTQAEKMEELQHLIEARKAEEQQRVATKRKTSQEEPIIEPVYFDINGKQIADPEQYRIDLIKQRARKQWEELERIHGKEQHEEIPEKSQNKPNKEPIDLQALQAEIDAKRAEEQRRQAEKEAEKERKRQQRADELVDKVKQMRQKQQGEAERQIEEDREKFPNFDEEKLKAALLNDKKFREDSADPKYKDVFIKEYGRHNYAMIQKCIQEIERDEKERIRQESIQRANTGY